MDFLNEVETLSRDALTALQTQQAQHILRQVANHPFYQKHLENCAINTQNLRFVEDLQQLPFLTKEDLRLHYPNKLLCVPQNQCVRMHCSSGTTGTPIAIFYTQNDLNTWAELMARSLYATGIRAGDVFQNMSGYGLFTGGLGIHYGAERLGCLTIPSGAGNTRRQIKLLKDFQVNAIHILPSYALHVANALNAPLNHLKIALVGAEPYTEEMRNRIQNALNIKVFNSFGLTEMNGPGVGVECEQQNGMHIWEDAYFVEIIDPKTGENVPDGQIGELVLSTLKREAMPLLRYRTRDLTRIINNECACGRKHNRIDRILGRTDDMFILKGVNIYPMQIEEVLMDFKELGAHYVIHLENQNNLENMRIKVEMKNDYFTDDVRALNHLKQQIAHRIKDEILLMPIIDLVEPASLPRDEGKAKRVLDLRHPNV